MSYDSSHNISTGYLYLCLLGAPYYRPSYFDYYGCYLVSKKGQVLGLYLFLREASPTEYQFILGTERAPDSSCWCDKWVYPPVAAHGSISCYSCQYCVEMFQSPIYSRGMK